MKIVKQVGRLMPLELRIVLGVGYNSSASGWGSRDRTASQEFAIQRQLCGGPRYASRIFDLTNLPFWKFDKQRLPKVFKSARQKNINIEFNRKSHSIPAQNSSYIRLLHVPIVGCDIISRTAGSTLRGIKYEREKDQNWEMDIHWERYITVGVV